ncbi:hypothetical protein ACFONL_01520 [Camelimonas fluminis]|uniref:Uncharacterized protein n=1 Tax=Camelimonas fluminis TaxID=1576911 RepID=A0ABV7UCE8_9HYPH|nr:hypothetical protein [Camelimonas fluminis]
MAIKIIASWQTLFQLAGAAGTAKLAMDSNPTPESIEAHRQAVRQHEEYRDICLKADEMTHFPDISSQALAGTDRKYS